MQDLNVLDVTVRKVHSLLWLTSANNNPDSWSFGRGGGLVLFCTVYNHQHQGSNLYIRFSTWNTLHTLSPRMNLPFLFGRLRWKRVCEERVRTWAIGNGHNVTEAISTGRSQQLRLVMSGRARHRYVRSVSHIDRQGRCVAIRVIKWTCKRIAAFF